MGELRASWPRLCYPKAELAPNILRATGDTALAFLQAIGFAIHSQAYYTAGMPRGEKTAHKRCVQLAKVAGSSQARLRFNAVRSASGNAPSAWGWVNCK